MEHRLPRSILPEAYDVRIAPDLDAHTFTGSVQVTANIVEATDVLVCNSLELDLSDVTIDGEPAEWTLDEANEQLRVQLGAERAPGPITFAASFAGELNDALKGFYRSTFTDDDGVEHTIATTQFQSTDARRAFPCWDEPDMKATFAITLVVDPQYTAVSNGAEEARVEASDGLVAISFAPTMVMSTYLVAFVVGPLEVSEPAFAGETPIRIVHRPGQGHLTQFALDVGVAALNYFEDYYGIPYPTDKLDMIALPDFAMGAMENLGCVTYREILLLVDPDTATQPELQNVADVINHELAHMWFGDLVTMGWWNGIWLNEAFATFMEMKATDSFAPDWKRWTSFGISRSAAFDIDSLVSTRPIEFPVISPADAEGMFDLLTYEKGAAVVRMLEQWLGEETFRDGIRHYLATHAYGNTETHDLWDALEHVAGRPVTAAMETWIFQGGYPMLEVEAEHMHQCRFTYSGDGDDATWSVPVQVRSNDGAVQVVELNDAATELPMPLEDIASFNHEGHGFYRVKLPTDRLAALGSSGTDHLGAVERFGLVDDTWTFTLGGQATLAEFFSLLDGYTDERDISVWQRVTGAVGFVHHVADDAHLAAVGARLAALTESARADLGDDVGADDDGRTRQLRGALLRAMGTIVDDDAAIARAEEIHAADAPDSELLAASVAILAAHGDDARFDDFRSRFENASSPQEEIRYLYSLPGFRGEAQIGRLVDMAIGGDIRSQNAPFVLAQALMHRRHGPMVWDRVATDWDAINEAFPANTIVRLLTGVRWLTDEATSTAVADFFANRPLPQGQKQLDQHLERLAVNAAFQARAAAELPEVLGTS